MIARILVWLAVIAACAAVLYAIVWGYETWRDGKVAEGDRAGAARVQALWDADRAQAQAAALEKRRLDAVETERRLKAQEENQRAQNRQIADARRDAERAAASADGLQLRATAYLDAAGCGGRTGDSAVDCIRQAVAQITDALGSCGRIARQVAADADDARARGLKCEADYDALTLKATTP